MTRVTRECLLILGAHGQVRRNGVGIPHRSIDALVRLKLAKHVGAGWYRLTSKGVDACNRYKLWLQVRGRA